MRILMFGRGVITTIYGWALTRAGHDVTFFVRPGRSQELSGRIGVDLIDARAPASASQVNQDLSVNCTESLSDLSGYDLAVVSVRHDQMGTAAGQLGNAPRPRKGILFFNNCWENPAAIESLVGAVPVLWGFPVAGGRFSGTRRLEGALMPNVHLAEAAPSNAELHAAARLLFESAGLKVELHADFTSWLWLHFAVNAGMTAQALIHGKDAAALVSSVRELSRAARLAREAVKVVFARGVDPKSHRSETAITAVPPLVAGIIIKSLAARSPATRRLMTLHTNPKDLARFPLDLLAEADRLGVSCPGLDAARAPAHALAERK